MISGCVDDTGTAGRIEHAQCPGRGPQTLTGIVPRGPGEITFATMPARAWEMITRTLDAGAPAARVAADEVYGGDSKMRAELQERAMVTCCPWPAASDRHPRRQMSGQGLGLPTAITRPDPSRSPGSSTTPAQTPIVVTGAAISVVVSP